MPLYKKNSKDDPNNYRPISVLPVLSKLLERHVSNHFYEYLTVHDLITARQSGFRPKHSCESALHLAVEDWLEHMYKKEFVGILFVDFCKEFDLVNHKLLLQKLNLYQVHSATFTWFTSYLSNRKQCVKVNSNMSTELEIQSGVPQGSILGPLLFLIFINDLTMFKSLGKSSLFADDVTDSVHSSEIGKIEKELQGRISDVEEWCVANLMVLSVEKTKVMLMGGKHKLASIPNSTNCLNIKAQERKIEQVQNERLLGVQIDNHLSWDEQVKKVKRTCLYSSYPFFVRFAIISLLMSEKCSSTTILNLT